jgi:alpha-tubulin suppressor-like RCC1 family protein
MIFSNLSGQNAMVGDGFGGRLWYTPTNLEVGWDNGFMVCGTNNQLYGWGNNLIGQLGDGTTTSTTSPVATPGMTNVTLFLAGTATGALKKDSTAWLWSLFSYINSTVPIQKLTAVKNMNIGHSHTVFVKHNGTAWAMGENSRGQLGNGTTSNTEATVPVQMTGVTNAVRAIAVGGNTALSGAASVILLANGTVKIAGASNFVGGVNDFTTALTIPGLNNIVSIAGNDAAVYALNSAGEVFSFGLDHGNLEF